MSWHHTNEAATRAAVIIMAGRETLPTHNGIKNTCGVADIIHREACKPLLDRIATLEASLRTVFNDH